MQFNHEMERELDRVSELLTQASLTLNSALDQSLCERLSEAAGTLDRLVVQATAEHPTSTPVVTTMQVQPEMTRMRPRAMAAAVGA